MVNVTIFGIESEDDFISHQGPKHACVSVVSNTQMFLPLSHTIFATTHLYTVEKYQIQSEGCCTLRLIIDYECFLVTTDGLLYYGVLSLL